MTTKPYHARSFNLKRSEGPWHDLWALLFTYSGVWRASLEEPRPAWYRSFPSDMTTFMDIVSRHRHDARKQYLPLRDRMIRLAVMICSRETCECGLKAVDVVWTMTGECRTMFDVMPVCHMCRKKGKTCRLETCGAMPRITGHEQASPLPTACEPAAEPDGL